MLCTQPKSTQLCIDVSTTVFDLIHLSLLLVPVFVVLAVPPCRSRCLPGILRVILLDPSSLMPLSVDST
jgi:hypothetical protein